MKLRQSYLGRLFAYISTAALLAYFAIPYIIQPVHAGNLTYTFVRFDRMKTSTATTGTVCAKQASAGTATTVKVTFPPSYTVSTTLANWTVDTTTGTAGWPKDPANDTTAATAWPGIGTATLVSGQDVTFPSTALTVGTWYCFNWINSAAVSTKSTATADNVGAITVQAAGPTTIDSDNYATATVANDQIGVTATVPTSFNFSLSSNAAALGTLSTATRSSAAVINARVDTNAFKGWNIWAADQTAVAGLTSTQANHTIAYSPAAGATAATLTAGVEGMNMGAGTPTQTSGAGTITVDPNFASGGTAFKGGGMDTILRSIALSTGTASNAVVPLTFNASISGITPAASDYATTVTMVAAGRF